MGAGEAAADGTLGVSGGGEAQPRMPVRTRRAACLDAFASLSLLHSAHRCVCLLKGQGCLLVSAIPA